jgi:hypothetical protein
MADPCEVRRGMGILQLKLLLRSSLRGQHLVGRVRDRVRLRDALLYIAC